MTPAGIYCDVLVYSSRRGSRSAVLRDCLLSQEAMHLHDGEVVLPRSTTLQFNEALLPNQVRNPAELDGDHVIVGFLDNDYGTPVILRFLPHPSSDIGKLELPSEIDVIGHRTRLISSDGDVRLWRHHGTFFGLQGDGSYVLDLSRGHAGQVRNDGTEQPYSESPAPNSTIRLRPGGTYRIEIVANPDQPSSGGKAIELTITENQFQLRLDGADNLTLEQSGANATLKVGDGAVHVAIGEHLETLYNQLKARLDAFDQIFATHVHGSTFGPTTFPEPSGSISAPAWNSDIVSSKVSLPDE